MKSGKLKLKIQANQNKELHRPFRIFQRRKHIQDDLGGQDGALLRGGECVPDISVDLLEADQPVFVHFEHSEAWDDVIDNPSLA